jgi:hypothetical protein
VIIETDIVKDTESFLSWNVFVAALKITACFSQESHFLSNTSNKIPPPTMTYLQFIKYTGTLENWWNIKKQKGSKKKKQ